MQKSESQKDSVPLYLFHQGTNVQAGPEASKPHRLHRKLTRD